MNNQQTESFLPPIPKGFGLPFYYSSLTNCGVFYLVEPAVLEPFVANKPVEIAIFDGQGVVTFNYQLYTGQFPFGANIVKEIELNIIVYAESQAANVPKISFEQFILGDEQTKTMGNLRVHVPCDNDIAIGAGIQLFGEPKFKTTFTTNLPSLNDPSVKTWQFTCHDPDYPDNEEECIFSCEVDVQGLNPLAGNFSPITEYGTQDGKLIAARWNILQPLSSYLLTPEEQKRVVTIKYGKSSHPMRQDLEKLISGVPAAAVRTFQSPPAAIQSRAYYL